MSINKTKEAASYISKLYWRTSNLMLANQGIIEELRRDTLYSNDKVISKNSIEDKLVGIFKNNLSHGFMSRFTQGSDKVSPHQLYKESYESFSKVLKVDDIKDNPYVKNIDLKNVSIKKSKIEYTTISLRKGEITPSDIERYDEKFNLNYIVGIYDENYDSPTLTENGQTWMNLVPSEFETMDKPIENAFGNVLVFGLGLGYYQYMISLKNNVEKITIVEKNPIVIRLFEDFILPQFEFKDKISIIKGDLFKLFSGDFVNKFDYCFIDTWFGRNDGLTSYLKLRKPSKEIHIKVDYWLEDGFKATVVSNMLLALYMFACLEEPIEKIADVTPPDALQNPASDMIYLKCVNYFLTKNIDLLTEKDVQDLISNDSVIHEIIYFEQFDISTVFDKSVVSSTNKLHSSLNHNENEYKWKKNKKKKKKKR